jgi:imidazole glycerol phosphate synthase subunit HisF
VENAAFYQQEGADKLAMRDIAATLENRKTCLEWVKNVSSVSGIYQSHLRCRNPLLVVASGAAGTLEHFYEGVIKGGANILLAASVFHYSLLSIRQVKEYLLDKGLPVTL